MSGQERVRKPPKKDEEGDKGPQIEKKKGPQIEKKGEKSPEDLDALLDEIDEILEENAEEFVKSYVQRGGE